MEPRHEQPPTGPAAGRGAVDGEAAGDGSPPRPALADRLAAAWRVLLGTDRPAATAAGAVLNPTEAEARQRTLLLRIVRGGFIVMVLTVTLLNVIRFGEGTEPGPLFELASRWWIPLGAAIGLAAAFLAVDVLTPRKKLQTFSGVVFGLIAGLIVTVALGFVIDLVAASWELQGSQDIVDSVKVLFGICLSYLGISIVLQTKDDFRLIIPYVEFARQIRGTRPLLADTSALVDARLADLAETGMVQAPVVVPGFVIEELQTLADSAERVKRAKGRRGLDVVARLRRSGRVDVKIDETKLAPAPVDRMLIDLARQMPAVIVTGDAALARIAALESIPTLSMHEVAAAMRPALVAGERVSLELIRRGEQPGQAVGFLEDGTMVVAEDGADRIGDRVGLTVRSTLQTAAGKLVFARLSRDAGEDDDPQGDLQDDAEPERSEGSGAPPQATDRGPRGGAPSEPGSAPAGDAPPAKRRPPKERGTPFPPKPPADAARARTSRNPRR